MSDINTGVPLIGATIAVVDGTNVGRATTSGADGTYRLVLRPGGLTIRARYDGYDSVFQGVTFVANTLVDIQMRPAMQTLAALTSANRLGTAHDEHRDVAPCGRGREPQPIA